MSASQAFDVRLSDYSVSVIAARPVPGKLLLGSVRAWRPVRARVLAVGLAMVVAGGCGGDDGPAATSTTTAPVGTAAASTTTAPAGTAATSTTTAPAGTAATSTTATSGPSVTLRADGLGVTAFGDLPEYAVAALTVALGEPTSDATEPSFSSFGTCPGTTLRAVEWGGLAVLITDGATAYGVEGGPHFFAYLYRSGGDPSLLTQEGVGPGSSVADLRAAYGSALQVNAGTRSSARRSRSGTTGRAACTGSSRERMMQMP